MRQSYVRRKQKLPRAVAAIRLERANAGKWRLRPDAFGMMGFPARWTPFGHDGKLAPPDARPDFLMRLDTGVNTALQVTASTPRTFLGAADHDPQVADNTGRFYAALHAARVPAELADYVATEKLSSIKITICGCARQDINRTH